MNVSPKQQNWPCSLNGKALLTPLLSRVTLGNHGVCELKYLG